MRAILTTLGLEKPSLDGSLPTLLTRKNGIQNLE